MLCENDIFDSKTPVTVVKVYKGGNALVTETDGHIRECAVANLQPREP